MATKLASGSGPFAANMHDITPHSAGIYADMTVDGPEIGTLVVIVDRAKNLPNRKTMGKQNPYCAARLGKEAKKTETDKRGGQTPRWDQELRFVVHDSPDYHSIKISVFSEDKRTDLIGEAWVSLAGVLVPGGGKNDLWQSLNFKGKYAGEIRMEFTYYDSRPKPEGGFAEDAPALTPGSGSKVKRRPLPNNPNGVRGLTPDTIPEPAVPGRARHGPRDLQTLPKMRSLPPEVIEQAMQQVYGKARPTIASAALQADQSQQSQPPYESDYARLDIQQTPPQQPDFLPQLPPSSRQLQTMQQRQIASSAQFGTPSPHQHSQPPSLLHSHSAPAVPPSQYGQDQYSPYEQPQLHMQAPDPLPDLDYQYQQLSREQRGASPSWQDLQAEPDHYQRPYAEDDDKLQPPPPPVHSHSAPAVPQYDGGHQFEQSPPQSRHGSLPQPGRQQYVPNVSPLQSIERQYAGAYQTSPHGHSRRGMSTDKRSSTTEEAGYDLNNITPPSLVQGQRNSPYSAARSPLHRHSVADPFYATPTRPSPLSQQIPRARSPLPFREPDQTPPGAHYGQDSRGREQAPMVKPRAISPQPMPASTPSPSRSQSSYSMQYPIRAFESSDESPLSTSNQPHPLRVTARVVDRRTPTRKSVSPHPSPPGSRSGVPFSPECFEAYNPASRNGGVAPNNSPHSPWAVRPGSSKEQPSGPIVGWHGQEIDPSDHLPVDSWAPEPIPKTPAKTYGLGRDKDFGPRSKEATPNSGSARHLSKDTVVNFRNKTMPAATATQDPSDTSPHNRNMLRKKDARGSALDPLRERHDFGNAAVPNPYEQQQSYSRAGGFARTHSEPYFDAPIHLESDRGYGLPALPPKVPLSQSPSSYYGSEDALSREISSIDIGSSGRHVRQGSAPPSQRSQSQSQHGAPHYVPVRSHRDRSTVYY